ncbi:integrase [Xanthomonas cerealis pv. cerealis]|uniref:Integrase n=1 Tax=Xanthomonas cerealis pv. cerealis TaxID=152263 RepID=A0A514ECR8_9XANT|nr:integrase [Xanthomonas translucens]QDI03820.1 integrase [Xanthomonas translucens pv. cerealis]
MSNAVELIADRLPRVTEEDVRRFAAIVYIRDVGAFAAELQAFVHERVEALELPARLEMETMQRTLERKASTLRADKRWTPNETEVQRGRTVLLETFNQPHNVPIPEFAKLADKSRQQIYKDILARRLLALNVGMRGQKLPDWQLDPVKQQLTQTVLQEVEGIDNWTIYGALSEPLEGLGGRSPVDAVTPDSIDVVAEAVFNVLEHCPVRAR